MSKDFYTNETKRMYQKGLRTGTASGIKIQRKIINEKIDESLEKLNIMREEFEENLHKTKDEDEKRVWVNEIANIISQQRLLKSLKED